METKFVAFLRTAAQFLSRHLKGHADVAQFGRRIKKKQLEVNLGFE